MGATIEPRQDELNQLYFEIFGKEEAKPNPARKPTEGHNLADEILIERAMLAKNGNDFNSLWNGSTLGYNGDDSAADMALMNHLAFWTHGNAGQMERLFSRSGLGQRDKWRDRPDYRDRTIQKAISDATEFYEPPKEAHYTRPALKFEDVFDETGVDKDGDPIYKFNHSKAADAILDKMPVVLGEDDLLYYWQGDIWADKAEDVLHNLLHTLAGKHYNRYAHKEVIAALRHLLAFSRVKLNPDPYLLGAGNGVVDLRTGEFRDYKKEDYISSQIPVRYDPLAVCTRFILFLEEVCPNPIDRLMLIDWLTLHAFRKAFPYLMFLVGRGRNGKGVFEYVLIQFFGKESFSFMALEEVANPKNNFAKANLLGKRGLIVSEAGDDTRRGKAVIPTKFLKLSTGDGTIDSDRKNTTRIQFSPELKATLDTNDMPSIWDTSVGWEERFCKVDMPFHFVDNPDPNNPREKGKDPHLKDKLTTLDELSGILNLLIERAKEISKTETITKRSGAEMVAEYALQSGSLNAFLERYCEYIPYVNGAPLTEGWYLDVVYQSYKEWCTHPQINADLVDDKRFGKALKKFCGGAQAIKERDGARTRRKIPGLMHFKDVLDKDLESTSVPLVPLSSIKVPLESATAPLVPLFGSIWEDIKKRYGNIGNLSSSLLLEKLSEKRPFNGNNGADSGLDGINEEVNGTPMEPTTKSNGTASCDLENTKTDNIKAELTALSSLKVQFKTDYTSDWHGAMRLFKEGEIVEISAERAEVWVKRGIVETANA